jgi:hypothetical protein
LISGDGGGAGGLEHETVWRHSETGSVTQTSADATLGALRQIGAAFESLIAFPELYVDLCDRVLVLVRRDGRTVDPRGASFEAR